MAELEAALGEGTATLSGSSASHFSDTLFHSPDASAQTDTPTMIDNHGEERSESVLSTDFMSLFHAPGLKTHAVPRDHVEQDAAAQKEKLINSAWRERAFEKLADIPVS